MIQRNLISFYQYQVGSILEELAVHTLDLMKLFHLRVFFTSNKKIKIYSTVHVPFLHPVYAARLSSTINSFLNQDMG